MDYANTENDQKHRPSELGRYFSDELPVQDFDWVLACRRLGVHTCISTTSLDAPDDQWD